MATQNLGIEPQSFHPNPEISIFIVDGVHGFVQAGVVWFVNSYQSMLSGIGWYIAVLAASPIFIHISIPQFRNMYKISIIEMWSLDICYP